MIRIKKISLMRCHSGEKDTQNPASPGQAEWKMIWTWKTRGRPSSWQIKEVRNIFGCFIIF
jgi:hypothetical protein